jgi:hypothetical protein
MNGTEHLDADELNAYAENALLPAARARYAAHLADCETCRKIITDLTRAGGVALALEKSAATPALDISKDKSWWRSIASFFTLPVVRYGVPALALLAIISVAYIATRQPKDSALVAQNKEPEPSGAANYKVEDNHSQSSSTQATTNAPSEGMTQNEVSNSAANANNNTDQSSARTREKTDADSARGSGAGKEVVPPTIADTGALSSSVPAAGPPVTLNKAGEAATRPEVASKAGPPKDSPAKAADEVANAPTPQQQRDDAFGERQEPTGGARAANQQRQQQQQQQARNMDRGRDMTIDGAQQQQNEYILKDKQARAASPAAPNASVARKRAAGPMKSEPRSESKTEREIASDEKSAGEKRSVGGRTFRRQGGAWIDTAYNSSRATVNVSRGSEQYRALLADEPSLRTIAEQLSGEVIVVWKGRAYRIH